MVKELTQTEIKNLFDYVDGELVWKKPKSNRVKKGDVAGTFKDGYRRISLNYTLYYAHRLIWLYHYGVNPKGMLDHIDMDRSNNRIENLREVTPTQNAMNRVKTKSNSSGFKGVSFHEKQKNGEPLVQLRVNKNISVFLIYLKKHMRLMPEK